MSKKKRIIFLSLAITILAVGYAIGAYFVDYALKRGNDTDPLAPPAACVSIHDKTREVPVLPKVKSEPWHNVSADGRNLAATHFFPEKPGKRWAILVHGYGRDQRYARDYAEAYLARGYQVLTPDLCASGATEGQYITMGVKESEEVARWAAQIKAYDPEAEIVLHGVSMGAATVLLAAAREDMPGLVAVIEDCGYTSAYEMFANQLGVIFGLPEFPIMPCVDVVSGFKTGAKVSAAAPLQVMPRIKVPVLFIHGDADTLVPPAMMEELFAACNAKKEKFVVVGAGHGDAMKEAGEEYWQRIFVFLAAEMK
jgi:fermentation-respiration switch protein FrsA (DUF1100 family)